MLEAQRMNQKISPENLGEPALKVAGFQLWIYGWQFPEADDYDDGNWLHITAHCGASGASIWAQGALVMVTDIARFGDQCAAMLRGDSSSAMLDPLEPELKLLLDGVGCLGQIRVQVEITPDHLAQFHKMEFEIDQSYLPNIIKQCAAILQVYPVRGNKD